MYVIIKIFNIWINFLFKKKYFLEFFLTLIFSFSFSFLFRRFLFLVESWDHSLGVFNDPLFFLDPINLSQPIFIITYFSFFFYIFYHLNEPIKLINLIQIIVILLSFRIVSLYFIRLDADPNMIVLQDPILNLFVYQINPQTGLYNCHDLFFSGHTANLFLLSILYTNKKLKYFFLILTFIVGTCLILQRAHYSIDVVFAPFFSILALVLHRKIKNIR